MRNDPFYRSVQRNLTQMFKPSEKEEESKTQTASQRA